MLYTLVLFASSILASSRPICKGFGCNRRTWNDKPGWCGRPCRDGRQKPETPVDVPPPPPVAHVPSVLTPPSEWHEPNEPLLCTSEPQAANDVFVRTSQDESGWCIARPCRDGPQKPPETLLVDQTLLDELITLMSSVPTPPLLCTSVPQAANIVFVRTSQDESGAHDQWYKRMKPVASELEARGATTHFIDKIKDSTELCTKLSFFPDGSISYLQISEHGDAAGRTGLLGKTDGEMKKLGDVLLWKLAPKAKIFLDSCNSGKAQTGSATLLSNHLNENHVIVGPTKDLPTDGVLFDTSSGLGEELLVELGDKLKRDEENNFMKANEILSLFDERTQEILLTLMDDNDLSISEIAYSLGLRMYENHLRFIRKYLTPLQLMKYNGKRK